MASNPYIGIDMGIDITALRTGLNDAKAAIQLADSEFKNNVAGLGKWSNSAEGLAQKLAYMATEVQAKQQIMEAYRAELDRVATAYGKDSTAAKKAQRQLNQAEADYKNAQAYTQELEQRLEEMASAEELAKKDSTTLSSSVKRLTGRVQAQELAVDATNAELEEAKRIYGEDSKQAQALTSKLKTQKQQLEYVEETLGAYERALETSNKDSRNATTYAGKFTTALGKMKTACTTAIKGGLNKLKEKLTDLGKNALGGFSHAIADFARQTVQLGMDFTSTMQLVKANSRASDEEMQMLEETARKFGASTTFSAVEAAEALNYMALASWDAQKSSEALGGILDLAAASGMDLASASDMVTDYLSAFRMQASESGHFADALAYAQSNANTTAEGLGEAYKNSAAKLAGAGQTMEATTALLMAMANQGTKGSEAGTALASTMADITKKMKDGAIQIGDTSIKVKDAKGDYRSLVDILADVEKATGKMGTADRSAALTAVFTSRSLTAVNEVLAEGTSKVKGYEKALHTSDGTAQEMADTMNDSLAGDMKALNSALQDVQLRIYDCLEGPLRGVVQFITDAIPQLVAFCEEVYNFFVKLYDDLKPLWDALKEFADWCGKIGALVGQAIGDIAEEMGKHENDFKTFGQASVDAVEEPWETAPGFFGDIWGASKHVFSDDGSMKTIGGSLVKGFTSGAGWNGVVGFFESIWNGITAKFDEKIEPLKKAGAGLYSAFTGAWNGATSWASNILNSIAGVFKDPGKTLQNVGGQMWGALKSGWTGIETWAGGIFNSIKGVFKDPANTLQSLGGQMWGALKSGWTGISSWASGVLGTINSALGDPAGTISATGSKLWGKLTGAFNGVGGWFTANVYNPMTSAFNGLATWATNTFGGVWNAISNAFSPVVSFFTNIYNGIMKAISPVLQFFGIKGADDYDPLASIKQQIATSEAEVKRLKSIYDQAYADYQTKRSTYGFSSDITTQARKASDSAYTAWNTARQELVKMQNDLKDAEEAASSGGLGDVGQSITKAFSGVKDAITKPFTEAWNTITGLFSGIAGWFEENVIKPLQKLLNPVGEAVSNGVVGGMVDAKQSITTGTQTLGEWIVGGLCDVLGIHSPSKVMRDKVGAMIGEGVAEGIADSARSVRAASEALGASVSIGGGRSGGQAVRGPATVVYNQTINSPDPVSVGQIYRDTRSLIGRREWA